MLKTRKEEIIKEEPEDEFVPQPKLMKLKHLMNSFWPMWSKRKFWVTESQNKYLDVHHPQVDHFK